MKILVHNPRITVGHEYISRKAVVEVKFYESMFLENIPAEVKKLLNGIVEQG